MINHFALRIYEGAVMKHPFDYKFLQNETMLRSGYRTHQTGCIAVSLDSGHGENSYNFTKIFLQESFLSTELTKRQTARVQRTRWLEASVQISG